MPRLVTPLADSKIKNGKIQSKDYSLSDGDGLYLLIKKTGSKIWRFNYYSPIVNTRTLISFGSYPEVSLQLARKKRDEAKELINQNIDPQEHKKQNENDLKNEMLNTFSKIANDWYEVKKSENLKEKTLRDIWRSLENNILPYIGNKPITKITPSDIITTLEPLKHSGKFETIKRVCQRVNEIMNYAINIGILNINPIAKVSAAFESPKTINRPTIEASELPNFMKRLSTANITLQTRCLIEW